MTTSMKDIPIQPLFKIYKPKPGDITSRIFSSHAYISGRNASESPKVPRHLVVYGPHGCGF